MLLDRSLINEPPTSNDLVYRCFKEFPVFVRHDSLNPHNHKMHVQPGIELNLTLEGQGTYVVDKTIMKQTPGQLLIIPGKLPHQVFIERPCSYKRMVVLIDDRTLSSLWPNEDFYWFSGVSCEELKLQPETYMTIRHLLFVMCREMEERKVGWQQMIVSGLMNLAVTVRRSLETGKKGMDPISQLCAYIDEHLSEDLSLKNMAHYFHMSPDHLIRTFKREKGVTFHQYVLLQRVFESKRLLLEQPDMSLTDIAYSVGFASSSQFSKTFKNISGQTPSEFRHSSNI